jgi:hypothetical protein
MQIANIAPAPALAASFVPSATTWLKAAIVYLIVGITIGIGMGATENFTLRPVHAHLNLLGWATVAIAGLVYAVFPAAARSRLARIHFWLHNTAVPVMMAALAAFLLGHPSAVPFLVAAEFTAAAGVLVFAWNVFANVRLDDAHRAG